MLSAKRYSLYVIALVLCSCDRQASIDRQQKIQPDTSSQITEQVSSTSFDQFLSYFPEQKLPLELRGEWEEKKLNEFIHRRIETAEAKQFLCSQNFNCNRDTEEWQYSSINAGFRLPTPQGFEAIVYSETFGVGHSFTLNIYTDKGKLISSLPISGIAGDAEYSRCKISEKLQITVEKGIPTLAPSFRIDSLKTFKYQINSQGEIQKESL